MASAPTSELPERQARRLRFRCAVRCGHRAVDAIAHGVKDNELYLCVRDDDFDIPDAGALIVVCVLMSGSAPLELCGSVMWASRHGGGRGLGVAVRLDSDLAPRVDELARTFRETVLLCGRHVLSFANVLLADHWVLTAETVEEAEALLRGEHVSVMVIASDVDGVPLEPALDALARMLHLERTVVVAVARDSTPREVFAIARDHATDVTSLVGLAAKHHQMLVDNDRLEAALGHERHQDSKPV